MPQLIEQYPETQEYLRQVPPHIVDRLGDIAVSLSHEDIPPVREPENHGRAWLKNAFSRAVTEPSYDQSLLRADAIEAARLGQESLSSTMNTAARLLGSAHSRLVDDGFMFGAEDLETDDQRDERERNEHRLVYNEAYFQAINGAAYAKQEGSEQESIKTLEAVLLLNHVEGHMADRHALRNAVRVGLAEELIDACKESRKLVQGERMARIVYGGVDFGASNLLQFYTGKHINSDFSEGDPLDVSSLALNKIDSIRDALAAATTPGSWYTPENATEFVTGLNNTLQVGDNLKLNPHLNGSQKAAAQYFYRLAEMSDFPGEMGIALECTDPVLAVESAKILGIPTETVMTMFGEMLNNSYNARQLNQGEVEEMAELKARYPEEFFAVVSMSSRNRLTVKPSEFTSGFDRLKEAGIDPKIIVPDLKEVVSHFGTMTVPVKLYLDIFSEFKKQGVESDRVKQILNFTGMKLDKIISSLSSGLVGPESIASNALINHESMNAYLDIYRQIDFKDTPPHALPDLGELSHITDRITDLGLPEAVSEAMLKSWMSFNALADYYFNEDEKFDFPDTTPDESTLRKIASKQAEALTSQLGKLEEFVQKFGLDTAKGVISTFGIYNFSKHRSARLGRQYEQWKAGAEVKTVIVSARHDWNSYSPKRAEFEFDPDKEASAFQVGNGVFEFEAGSGAAAARIAVMVGKHERENGREPGVHMFIINGHGSSDMVQMDYDQTINTHSYREVAERAAKIGAKEVNDYKRHLGPNFRLILQACSVAGKSQTGKNLAESMVESHKVPVDAYKYTIYGVSIFNDGSVAFKTTQGDGQSINYKP